MPLKEAVDAPPFAPGAVVRRSHRWLETERQRAIEYSSGPVHDWAVAAFEVARAARFRVEVCRRNGPGWAWGVTVTTDEGRTMHSWADAFEKV